MKYKIIIITVIIFLSLFIHILCWLRDFEISKIFLDFAKLIKGIEKSEIYI